MIVEGARAEFAIRKGERARRGRRPIDRFHHLNAVARSYGAPSPPTLVTCTDVLPVAAPPLMTNRSEGDPSPPSTVLMAIAPPAPV